MKVKLISIGAVVLVLALLLTLAPSCGKEEGEIKTLKIGFLAPLSGAAAPWGIPSEVGAKWAADKINAAGGLKVGADRYMIEIVSCDTEMTGSVAADCATRFVYEEGIHYVVGAIGLSANEAADPIFTQGKVIYIAQGTTSAPRPESPYRLNGTTKTASWTDAFYSMFTEHHPEIKTICLVAPRTDVGDMYVDETLNIFAPTYGITVLDVGQYESPGTEDFYPVLSPLVAKNPDAIDVTGGSPPGSVALITKQVRELGFEGWIIQPGATDPKLLINVAGAGNVRKILCSYPGWSSEAYPARTRALFQEWLEDYARPGEEEMGITTSNAYKAMLLLRDAIEEAGSIDVDEVMKVIDDPDFRFDIFTADNQRLGGVEAFGIRRQFPHPCPYGEIIDADHISLSLDFKVINVP